MSENLDLVRSIYAAWERGDFSSAEWAHPEIEFVAAEGPDPSQSTGVAAMTQRWRQWMTAWENYRSEADEYRDLDGERVLVLMRHGGRGKTSGVEVEQLDRRGANLFHIRDGKVVRLTLYWERENALADLDLNG
jgi:ketosteroid isomerase-like protein